MVKPESIQAAFLAFATTLILSGSAAVKYYCPKSNIIPADYDMLVYHPQKKGLKKYPSLCSVIMIEGEKFELLPSQCNNTKLSKSNDELSSLTYVSKTTQKTFDIIFVASQIEYITDAATGLKIIKPQQLLQIYNNNEYVTEKKKAYYLKIAALEEYIKLYCQEKDKKGTSPSSFCLGDKSICGTDDTSQAKNINPLKLCFDEEDICGAACTDGTYRTDDTDDSCRQLFFD